MYTFLSHRTPQVMGANQVDTIPKYELLHHQNEIDTSKTVVGYDILDRGKKFGVGHRLGYGAPIKAGFQL